MAPPPAPRIGAAAEVVIEALGRRGDGVARLAGTRIFVPFALPGDRLRVRLVQTRGEGWLAEPLEWRVRAERALPPCPHFGVCGGCQLQHVPHARYAAWQREQVIAALARQGLGDVVVEPIRLTSPGSRRRARLAFVIERAGVLLGFRARRGHRIVPLEVCPVLLPAIVGLLGALRGVLAGLEIARPGGEVLVTATDSGLDVLLATRAAPGLADRMTLAAFAETEDLARLAWRAGVHAPPEPIAQRRPVVVRFAGVAVEPPPGAFLQATEWAEAALREAVESALGDAQRVADLFAGCGTFALPLAASGREVRALENDAPMLDALSAAARRAGWGARVTAERRDLQRAPLAGPELTGLDGVVVDPPHHGAHAQAAALAGSGVPRIAMASCNPVTFARDARLLVEGGYRLRWVRPVDAFLWSSQIELVGAFARDLGSADGES